MGQERPAEAMASSNSEVELLKRARHGDPQAAERLLTSHRDKLQRMVRARMDSRLSARLDPSDVVQEALMEANRRLPAFLDKNDDLFYPWLRAIVWERLVQLNRQHLGARKRSVHREVGFHLPDASATELSRQLAASISSPSRVAVRKELQQRVQQGLEMLQASDKEILLLRHLEQLSMDEFAAVLGITPSAAQSRYRRALERFHELLCYESMQ